MEVIPAIDLMKGKVVRLSRGDPSTAKAYDQLGTPIQIAMNWKSQGAKRLHIIDLDAAFGSGENLETIADIVHATSLPVQVGGGIRTVGAVEQLLKLGIDYIILGSLAFSHPEIVSLIQEKFGSSRVIVALDTKEGKVMVDGWRTQTELSLSEAQERFAKTGVNSFLITSITKDGMLSGPDLETLGTACLYPSIEVIAAGGISNIADLKALKRVGVEAAVVGKALYEGRFTLKEAIETMEAD
jgi:phosphoribosylformimino-5-aminoimidazole carboxamide ribotide isomerase